MSNEYNYPHIRIQCNICKNQEHVVYDSFHDETYCKKCGNVLKDNTLPSITREIEEIEYQVKFIRDLWKKK